MTTMGYMHSNHDNQPPPLQGNVFNEAITSEETKAPDVVSGSGTSLSTPELATPNDQKKDPEFFLPKFKNFHFMIPLDKDFAFPTTDVQISLEFRSTDDGFGLISMRDEASSHDREVWFQGGILFSRVWNQAGDETIFAEVGEANDGDWHRVTLEINSQSGTTLYLDDTPVAQGKKKKSEFDWATDLHIGYTNLHTPDTPVDFYSGGLRNAKVTTLAGDIIGHWSLVDHDLEDLSPYQRKARRVLESYQR